MRSLLPPPPSACGVLLLLALPARAEEADYDLLVRGGKVVDGSGNPWFLGDVAVREGRIAAVGRLPGAKAKRVIDARGLVVAPGFIDMHSHSDSGSASWASRSPAPRPPSSTG
jgi:N-acyl-D-aspartate/D-glutamate deacylase